MAKVSHAFFILDREINVCVPSGAIGMFWWLAVFFSYRSEHVEIIEATRGTTSMCRQQCRGINKLCGSDGSGGRGCG